MNFETYLAEHETFAVYPDAGSGSPWALGYVGLGLAGEVAELTEKVIQGKSANEVIPEAGDVLWYTIRGYCELHDKEFAEIRQIWAWGNEGDWPRGTRVFHVTRMSTCAGNFADHAKKLVRGDENVDRVLMRSYLFVVLIHLGALVRPYGFDLPSVAQRNLNKLESRLTRGVIRGSGDDR